MAPQVGDELPQYVIDTVDSEKMKTMAALLHDPNPIHWDVDAVKALGMGDKPVNQGPNNMAYVANMLANYSGGIDRVKRLRVRFLANVFGGDRLVAGGKVTAVTASGSDYIVDCDVWLARNGDEPVVAGSATVSVGR